MKKKISTISHKGSHHHPHQIWNVPFHKSTNHALIEPPNTSQRVPHPSAQTPTKPTNPPPTGPRNIEPSTAATKSQIGARSNPELEREIPSKKGTRWGKMRLPVPFLHWSASNGPKSLVGPSLLLQLAGPIVLIVFPMWVWFWNGRLTKWILLDIFLNILRHS